MLLEAFRYAKKYAKRDVPSPCRRTRDDEALYKHPPCQRQL
jgi:hypothetical protein